MGTILPTTFGTMCQTGCTTVLMNVVVLWVANHAARRVPTVRPHFVIFEHTLFCFQISTHVLSECTKISAVNLNLDLKFERLGKKS